MVMDKIKKKSTSNGIKSKINSNKNNDNHD
jgi:hypothetical protein